MDYLKEFDPVEFGKNLKSLRQKKGLSQEALGTMVNVDQSVISGYENGKKVQSVGVDNAMRLAQALDTSVDYLCGISHDDRDITPFQWFVYTLNLINNPPAYLMYSIPAPGDTSPREPGRYPIVKLVNGRDNTASIVFTGSDVKKFFNAYFALKESMESNVDTQTYKKLIKTLFDSYSDYFTVGWSEFGNYSDGVSKGDKNGEH